MMGRKWIKDVEWRDPNEEDMKKLSRVKKAELVYSLIFLFWVLVMICAGINIIRKYMSGEKIEPASIIIGGIVSVIFLIFLIRRIHFKTSFKVADVIVEEIVRNNSTETGNMYTAIVSQGNVKLDGINIHTKNHPDVGEKVLLYIANNDDWSVGIV